MGSAPTVLIVDDDPDIRDYMERSLRREPRIGDVLQAEDGERAWALVRSGRVDLLVTDMVIPHLDGFALCERLDGDPEWRSIPILLITGDAAYRPGGFIVDEASAFRPGSVYTSRLPGTTPSRCPGCPQAVATAGSASDPGASSESATPQRKPGRRAWSGPCQRCRLGLSA